MYICANRSENGVKDIQTVACNDTQTVYLIAQQDLYTMTVFTCDLVNYFH